MLNKVNTINATLVKCDRIVIKYIKGESARQAYLAKDVGNIKICYIIYSILNDLLLITKYLGAYSNRFNFLFIITIITLLNVPL